LEWEATGPTGKGIALVTVGAIAIAAVYLLVFGLTESGLTPESIGNNMGRLLLLILLLVSGSSWIYWYAHVQKKEHIDKIEMKVSITPDHIRVPMRWGRTKTIPKGKVRSIRAKLDLSMTLLELRTIDAKYDLPWTVGVELVTDGYSVEDPDGLLGPIHPLETDPDVFSDAEID
jgi:hypothetical protein